MQVSRRRSTGTKRSIDVYGTEGAGKNRMQRITICYRFAGYLEIPVPDDILLALDMRRVYKPRSESLIM